MHLENLKIDDKAIKDLNEIALSFQNIPNLSVKDFSKENTLLLHIDIVNGFLFEGPLHSPLVAKILPHVVALNELMLDYKKLFILDTHKEGAVEFEAYPPHCIINTKESEIVNELKKYTNHINVIRKNSTNLFHAKDFKDWLKENREVTNFIIVGGVSDICIMQIALTLKTYFNEDNIKSRIIVPTTCIETFNLDATNHNSSLMNLFSLYNLKMNGIEIVKEIV